MYVFNVYINWEGKTKLNVKHSKEMWAKARRLFEDQGYSDVEISMETGISVVSIGRNRRKEKWIKPKSVVQKDIDRRAKTCKLNLSVFGSNYQSSDHKEVEDFLNELKKIPIADDNHILHFLTKVIVDVEVSIKDRLQAIRLLAETKQMIGSHRREEEDDTLNNQMEELIKSIKE